MSGPFGSEFQESDLGFRQLLSKVIAGSTKSREQIASELSQRVGRLVTVPNLNDYTRTTKTSARFPAAYVKAFCEVVGNDLLQRLLLGPRLLGLIEIAERELDSQRSRSAKDSLIKRFLTDEDRAHN